MISKPNLLEHRGETSVNSRIVLFFTGAIWITLDNLSPLVPSMFDSSFQQLPAA